MLSELYDASFEPPAPALEIALGAPVGSSAFGVTALVDSGADVTVLPSDLVARLGLRRVGLVSVSGLSRRATSRVEYSVKVGVPGLDEHIIRAITWTERYALLGRDVLNHWRVTLDGPNQTVEIS